MRASHNNYGFKNVYCPLPRPSSTADPCKTVVADIVSHRCPQITKPTLPPTEIISWKRAAEHAVLISGQMEAPVRVKSHTQTQQQISWAGRGPLTHSWWCSCCPHFQTVSAFFFRKDMICQANAQFRYLSFSQRRETKSFIWGRLRGGSNWKLCSDMRQEKESERTENSRSRRRCYWKQRIITRRMLGYY